ncbi:Hypothetical protein CM240_2547 [Clostridium bornimense]|uniref:GumN family protein n=1 Tax=Clostridium bornimense TaxID=1216932 RepID=W6RYD1_9CLOT|nr:TraB/GumN family protein [Clostridium bornimense]CDM69671.1 Hypothetical protein CM240_2547 [Clostridium bornimense]
MKKSRKYLYSFLLLSLFFCQLVSNNLINPHKINNENYLSTKTLATAAAKNTETRTTSKPTTKGYLWKATKDSKEIYLIGTIHCSDPNYDFYNDELLKIINKCDTLAVEINPTMAETLGMSMKLLCPAGDTIESQLTDEEIFKLKTLCMDYNLNYSILKTMNSTGICMNLNNLSCINSGLTGEGLDNTLMAKFKCSNKNIIQLESIDLQFDRLSKLYDISTLKEILNSYKSNTRNNSSEDNNNRVLFTAFINGDEHYMLDSIELSKKCPKEYDLLIKSRNENMVDEIERNISNNKNLAVAVGALHYFGEDGIINQLQNKGYTIEKIKTT